MLVSHWSMKVYAFQEARDWSERLLASYRELAEREYLDTECSHHNL